MFATLDFAARPAARRRAALPDGRRQARRPRRRGRARGRHVRLRAADPLGPQRPGVHLGRPAQPAQRAPRRGHRPARRALRLPDLRAATRAPTCTTCIKAGEILGAMLLTEHNLVVLPAADAGDARGDRGRAVRGFRGRLPARLSAEAERCADLLDHEERKRRAWTLAALAVGSILLWQTYWGSLLLYPFTILATWFHEMGHGLAAILDRRAVRAAGDLPRRLGRRAVADPGRRLGVLARLRQRGGAARAAGRRARC